MSGGYYMDLQTLRCGRCDGRYCWNGCHAGEPGYVYVTGCGDVPFADVAAILAADPHHRVDWADATPAEDDAIDAICLAALAANPG